MVDKRKISLRPASVLLALLALALLASACRRAPASGPQPPSGGSPPAPSPTHRTRATESFGLPSTGGGPEVVVQHQTLHGNAVIVSEVTSIGPGWLVIFNQKDGQRSQDIGRAAVHDGLNRNVQVEIDPALATRILYAVLYLDSGSAGVFENPGPDVPIVGKSEFAIAPMFVVDFPAAGNGTPVAAVPIASSDAITASLRVEDQDATDGSVTIAEAASSAPAWVVVYTDEQGHPAGIIGNAALPPGDSYDIEVAVDPGKVTPELYALVHADAGEPGKFEFPGPDAPVLTDIRLAMDGFQARPAPVAAATAAPEGALTVLVSDQPVRGGTVRVEEASSDGPGWLGVHMTNPDGSIGSAIGAAQLVDGENYGLIVRLDQDRATGALVAMLHTDGGQIGVWEFPGPDGPVMVDDQMVMADIHVTGGLTGDEVTLKISGGESPHLTDSQGNSLYISLADRPGRTLCDARCHVTWLPLTATGSLVAEGDVDVSKLGVIALAGGEKQVAYGGLPLYYYAGDSQPGDEKGQGIENGWFLAAP